MFFASDQKMNVNSQFKLKHENFLDKNVIVPTFYEKCLNTYL